MSADGCPLCREDGGAVLWRGEQMRVIAVRDADYPGFLRVVWNAHVREMTDLSEAQRLQLLRVVMAVETAVRDVFAPDKVNLASLGNVVPHLHWHVIARGTGDAHFPDPVWAARRRDPDPEWLARQRAALALLPERLVPALDALAAARH